MEGLGAVVSNEHQRTDKSGTPTFGRSNGAIDYANPTMIRKTEPNLTVRIGSILALERISNQKPEIHLEVMEILCAHLRENTPKRSNTLTEPPFKSKRPRSDIQLCATVLGRRNQEKRLSERAVKYRLDLTNCDLDGVDFRKGEFSATNFTDSRLEAADFRDANLDGALFYRCLLNFADLFQADLTGAKLDFAVLNRPIPIAGGMDRTLNMAASIRGVSLTSADLSAIDYLGEADKVSTTFGSSETIVSDAIRDVMPEHDLHSLASRAFYDQNPGPVSISALEKIKHTGFQSWSPYTTGDFGTGKLRADLYRKLGLVGWPYN